MPTRADFALKALEFLDVPFHWQGRSRKGIDCAGLPVCAGLELGLPVKDSTSYSRRDCNIDFLLGFCEDNGVKIRNGTGGYIPVEEGQILIFLIKKRLPHLAIALGSEFILHTYETVGKVKKTRFDYGWQKDVHSVWELRGLTK